MVLNRQGINVIATRSSIIYKDIIQGFLNKNKLLSVFNDDYKELLIEDAFDFEGDVVLNPRILDKYKVNVVNHFVTDLDEVHRDKLLTMFSNLNSMLEDSLLLEDLPLEINFETDIKKLLRLENLHFDQDMINNPYAIIEMILRIHRDCQINSVPVICNLTHYLDKDQFAELYKLTKSMIGGLVLIEFTDLDIKRLVDKASYFYIDEDMVDWY